MFLNYINILKLNFMRVFCMELMQNQDSISEGGEEWEMRQTN
jgi:hypothetical protein